MTDREKVILGLKCLTNEDPYMSRVSCKKKKCPYVETETDNCAPAIWRDALKLLRAQEPVKPWCHINITPDGASMVIINCGACHKELARVQRDVPFNDVQENVKYCIRCGKAVKWDAAD